MKNEFYVFDTVTQTNLLQLPMKSYFGHLYVHNGLYLVADAQGLYCISPSGSLLWHNDQLGIDGVVASRHEGNLIFGEGE